MCFLSTRSVDTPQSTITNHIILWCGWSHKTDSGKIADNIFNDIFSENIRKYWMYIFVEHFYMEYYSLEFIFKLDFVLVLIMWHVNIYTKTGQV